MFAGFGPELAAVVGARAAREEMSVRPWLDFYVQDGHAYAAAPGGDVHPLAGPAPPFTLTYTSGA